MTEFRSIEIRSGFAKAALARPSLRFRTPDNKTEFRFRNPLAVAGWLYDPADADLAQSELDERDRRAAECSKQREAAAVKEAELRETIKARCAKSGCTMRFGYGCPRSEHKHGGCVELIKHYRRARDEENRHAS